MEEVWLYIINIIIVCKALINADEMKNLWVIKRMILPGILFHSGKES